MSSKNKQSQALSPLPAGSKNAALNQQRTGQLIAKSESWAGPLPPPQALKGFDDVVPGSAATIIKMAENQQNHRMSMELKLVDQRLYGLIAGALVALIAVGGAIYLAKDQPWVAGALVSLPVLGMVQVIVNFWKSSGKENKQDKLSKK